MAVEAEWPARSVFIEKTPGCIDSLIVTREGDSFSSTIGGSDDRGSLQPHHGSDCIDGGIVGMCRWVGDDERRKAGDGQRHARADTG